MMLKTSALALGVAALMGSTAPALPPHVPLPTLLACGDDQIRALRLDGEHAEEVWRWNAADAADLPEEWRHGLLAHIDDCKPVDGGKSILATSSTGGTVMIDRASGHVLFHAHTPMAHSADLLPGGLIAVALSLHDQGNRLQIYRLSGSEQVLAEAPLYSGHGAVWDAARGVLFVLSHDAITALAISKGDGKARIEERAHWDLPGQRDGHDLSPRGDGRYFVTTHDGVWVFDPDAGSFSPFARLNPARNIKAITTSGTTIAWMQAEESWWAHGFSIAPLGDGPARRYPLAGIALYKVRWAE